MDKYTLVVHIIDHPEEYTPEQLTRIFSDPETREIYRLLCNIDMSVKAHQTIDTEAEWKRFAAELPRRRRWWSGSRAAAIAAIVGSSIVAVAGLALTVRNLQVKSDGSTGAEPAVEIVSAPSSQTTHSEASDSTEIVAAYLQFENSTLEEIITAIGNSYGLKIRINNPESAALHLFYRFDPTLSVEEILAQLNTFEQIRLTLNGDTIEVD